MYAFQRFSCPSFFHPSTNRRMYRLLSEGVRACRHAGRSHTSPTLWADNARPRRDVRLAETRDTAIGGVAQHRPDGRAFPASAFLASRDALGGERAGEIQT